MRRATTLLLLSALLLAPAAAWARSTRDFTYSYEAIWTTAMRLTAPTEPNLGKSQRPNPSVNRLRTHRFQGTTRDASSQ